jgi:hypothetical protein
MSLYTEGIAAPNRLAIMIYSDPYGRRKRPMLATFDSDGVGERSGSEQVTIWSESPRDMTRSWSARRNHGADEKAEKKWMPVA